MINTTNIDFTFLYDSAAKLVQMYRQELEAQNINASGALSRSADFDFDFDENKIVLYFIYNSYGFYVEYGRKPSGSGGGQTWEDPVGDIMRWMQNKNIVPSIRNKVPTGNEMKRAAQSIVHKIHTQGWYTNQPDRGKHVLRNVLEKAEQSGMIRKMLDSIADAYTKQIDIEIENF